MHDALIVPVSNMGKIGIGTCQIAYGTFSTKCFLQIYSVNATHHTSHRRGVYSANHSNREEYNTWYMYINYIQG